MSLGGNALEGMREAGPYIGLGFQLFAAIALGTGGGYWLDTKLGTLPGLTLVGAAASFALILFLVLRMANNAEARSKSAGNEGGGSSSSPPPGDSPPDRSASGDPPSGGSTLQGGPDFHSGHKRRFSDKDR